MTTSADNSPHSDEPSVGVIWRLPAALLYLTGPRFAEQIWEPLARRLEAMAPGLVAVSPGVLVTIPDDRTADLLDAALEMGLRLLAAHGDPDLPDTTRWTALVAPGNVERREGQLVPDLRDPLVRSILDRPHLDFPPGVYVTSRAVHSLEGNWELAPAGNWATPELPEVPIHQATRGKPMGKPRWRNPEIFGRSVPWVPRRRLERAAGEALATGRCRLLGPIGSGKSRLAAEVLTEITRQTNHRIVTTTPSRIDRSLLERLVLALDELLGMPKEQTPDHSVDELIGRILEASREAPLCLVFDDLQRASTDDHALLSQLLATPHDPKRLLLVLIGRDGTSWTPDAEGLLTVEVPLFSSDEALLHAARVCEGLEMPQDVMDRFSEAAGGSPFCFEEGILELIHRRALRRVYGSFFFGAPNDIDLTPSPRFLGHLLTAAARSKSHLPLVALAAAGQPIPHAALVATFGEATPPQWASRPPVADWLTTANSPWGKALRFRSTAMRNAFDAMLASDSRRTVRSTLGAWLGRLEDSTPEARWEAYELMAGTPGASDVLLQSLESQPDAERREAVFAAFCHELAELRRRGGTESEEIRLLWALLPLARRMGRLRDIRPDLDRALVLCEDIPAKLLAISTLLAELDLDDGRPREAERSLRRAIEIAITSDPKRKPLLGVQLGRLLQREGRNEEARQLLQRLLEEIDDPASPYRSESLSATCRFYLGNTALSQRRFHDALDLHRQALSQRRQHSLDNGIGASLCALGATHRALGEYRQSLEFFEQAHHQLLEHGREGEVSFSLVGLASIRSRIGQPTLSTQLLREALELRAAHEGSVGEALVRLSLAENLLELDQFSSAQEEARRAHFRLSLIDSSPHLGRAERLLGCIDLKLQNGESARDHLRRASEQHRKLGYDSELSRDLSWQLVEAMERQAREEVEGLVRRLVELRETVVELDRGEFLDYRLYSALAWLVSCGSQPPAPPIQYLRKAYREVLRKTGELDQEQRSTFLMQVAEHQEIVTAATQNQLSLPEYL